MSSLTQEEITALSFRAQGPGGTHTIAMPAGFLSLAPTTSASYPKQAAKSTTIPSSSASSASSAAIVTPPKTPDLQAKMALGAAAPTAMELAMGVAKERRSSSITSTGSNGSAKGARYLKLGPVHWGEGDGKGDWSEVVTGDD